MYEEMDKVIYLQQLEGYVITGKENSVCRLHEYIIGLKHSSCVAWNRYFDRFLEKFGLRPSAVDPCHYLGNAIGEFVNVTIWVNYMCNNNNLISDIIDHLWRYFDMRCNTFYLSRSPRKTLFLSQLESINKTLENFVIQNCSPRNLPTEPGQQLQRSSEKKEPTEMVPYREDFGSFIL